jgi:hypothetical protein
MTDREVSPWTWTKLSIDEARGSWQAVTEFVAWLVQRFDLGDVIPPCWWAHGAMVEELTALWAAWSGAYQHPDAGPDAPIEWLDHLATSRVRLVEWDKMGCAQRGHREATPTGWQVDEDAFAAFVAADLAARPGPQRLLDPEEATSRPDDYATSDDIADLDDDPDDEPC